MTPWIVGAAALALGVLALTAWLLRRARSGAPLDATGAGQAAATAIPGFTARAALIGDDRRTALVVGEGARVALVTAKRSGPNAREVQWHSIRAVGGGLRIEAGARAVLVPGIDALDVRRAGGEAWRAAQPQPTKRTPTPSASRVTRAETP